MSNFSYNYVVLRTRDQWLELSIMALYSQTIEFASTLPFSYLGRSIAPPHYRFELPRGQGNPSRLYCVQVTWVPIRDGQPNLETITILRNGRRPTGADRGPRWQHSRDELRLQHFLDLYDEAHGARSHLRHYLCSFLSSGHPCSTRGQPYPDFE